MKKVILFIPLFFLICGTAHSQWLHQQSGVSTQEWRNVEFLNENTGYVCGMNTILKTTNGGINWISQNIPFSYTLRDISIIDSNIVYCAGNYGRMLKTTNGGVDWINLYSDTLAYMYACSFVNKDTGWFAGVRGFPNYSFLVKTTDGGVTFISQAFANIAISDIYFKDANTGLLVATGSIWRTTNGGTNWYSPNYNFNGSGYAFNRFGIVNDQYCWIASRTRPVYRSTDFGENWDSIAYIPSGNYNINSTFFITQNTGWVGLDFGRTYKTVDGGFTWVECATPQPTGFISDIFFLNETTGWAVEGNNGNIFRTTTGGCNTIGIVNNSSELPGTHTLYQNYPNPFNPMTSIKFKVNSLKFAELKVYDIIGREAAVLVNESLSPGEYEVSFNGADFSSGVYFYSLTVDNKLINIKKMLLIK